MLACFFGTAASVPSLVCQCELETQPSAHGGLQLLAWESVSRTKPCFRHLSR
jgi:hypothetical protein